MKKILARQKFLKHSQFFAILVVAISSLFLSAPAEGQAAFVQAASSPNSFVYTNSIDVPYTGAQVAGNLNIVVVGWSDTSGSVASVVDSNGNTYAVAAGTVSTALPAPGSTQPGVSQAVYYAKNIVAGANTVTVNFNQNTAVQSIRILEYSGIDATNPLDTSVGASGNAVPADSGPATTNSANDLIFGAGTITTAFTGSGPGFVLELLNGFGDIAEDQFVVAAGPQNATGLLVSGSWVMQMAAFRVAGQTPPTFLLPTITSLSSSTGPEAGGTTITITGTNFEPGASVIFTAGAVTASGVNCVAASTTTITCLTPALQAGTAGVTVTNVDGQTSASSPFNFTASTPFSTATTSGISPNTGTTNGGATVNITGSDFAAGAKVTIGGVPADKVLVANVNTIQASVPAGSAGTAAVVVTNPSNTPGTLGFNYTYTPATTISFVQANSAQPASPAATAPVAYTLPQTAANLNVVIIGWSDATTTVASVTDTAGNTYVAAIPPVVGTGLSQAIYYAKNIVAAATNTVTVTFSAPAPTPDVRILEYSGIDPVLALDSGGGRSGTGFSLSSGPITTTNVVDLIIGAATVAGKITDAGPGFTTVTVTPNGANVEHLIGQQAGVIDAGATQGTNVPWVMQAVAFEQAGSVPDFGLTVTAPGSGTASVPAGSPATYTIAVSEVNAFANPVALTCSAGLPPSATCTFAPASVTPAGTPVPSTLTINTAASTPTGTSTVTATGTSGSLTHDVTVGLTVTPGPDFAITSAVLSPATVQAGGTSTTTVTIAPANGFLGDVALTCSVAPAGAHAPTCAFNPPTVAGGTGTSTLTVSTAAGTTTGLSTVTITGTAAGGLTHGTTVSLTVTPGPDFTISGAALSPASVAAGGTATSTITIAPTVGFTGDVALICSVAPAGARSPSCSLSPATVTGATGTSTLTVNTTAATSASLAPKLGNVSYALWLPIGGLTLLGAGFTSRKKKLWGLLLGCLMFSALIFLAACGGSSSSGGGGGSGHPGTPAGTYTITVTGTSGSLTHTATETLTVQ